MFLGDCPSGGMMLTLGSGGSETPRSSPVAAAVVPFSRRFDQSPGAMKEKEIHAKHMKVRPKSSCPRALTAQDE